MAKKYSRVNWAAYPSKTTPMSADNLNIMDKGIDDLDNAVNSLETSMSGIEKDVSEISTEVTALADAQPVILTGTLAAGETTIAFTDDAITTESMLEFFATIPRVPEPDQSFDEATGTLTLTFEAQSEDMGVKVRVS